MDILLILIILGIMGHLIEKKSVQVHPIIIFLLLILFLFLFYTYIEINLDTLSILHIIFVALTAIFIGLQLKYNKRLADYTILPHVYFVLISGSTLADFVKRRGERAVFENLMQEKLFTKIFIKNNSKFPVYFWVKISLIIYNRNDECIFNKLYNPTDKKPWRLPPELVSSYPAFQNILAEGVLGRKYEQIRNEDESCLTLKLKEVKEIIAEVEVSYAPVADESLKFKIKPEKWRFELKESRWRDPQGTRDDRVGML